MVAPTRVTVPDSTAGSRASCCAFDQALADRERGLGGFSIRISSDDLSLLAESSEGDARKALTVLEVAVEEAKASSSSSNGLELRRAALENALQSKILLYDKAGDGHFGVISAFIKSMRGSDPDAAVYYLVRMLESGEQPRFLLRRMVIFASEDVGNADPRALAVATDALRAFELVGLPEGVLPMVQCAAYLALAPKSNAVLEAYGAARKLVRATGSPPVPKHLLNPSDPLSRQLGHGTGYRYPHAQGGVVPGETYLPEALGDAALYEPRDAGFERELRQRVDEVRRLRTREPAPNAPPEPNPKDVK